MKKANKTLTYVGLVGGLIMSLTLATTVLSAPAKDGAAPFKIGLVTSTSGPGLGYGQRAVIGIRYRVEEEINKSGGINGHPVKLIIYDTGTKPDQAAMLVERAVVVDKVAGILGPNASSDVTAANPTAKRLGVPIISLGGLIPGLIEQYAPWCFSTMISADFWGEPLNLLIDRYKVKSMVMMADAKYNYSVSQAEWVYKIADRNNVKVLHDKGKLDVETGWADFTPQVTRIKSLHPDLISACLFPSDLAHLAVALKGAGIDAEKTPIWGCSVFPDFVVAAGEAGEEWYGSGEFDPDSADPVQRQLVRKMTDYGKTITTDPGIYTVQFNTAAGYTAAAFLCEAIRRTKITPDTSLQEAREKIRDELPKIRMKTYGSVENYFSEGGRFEKNRLVRPIFMFQVKKGKLVTVGEVK